jgi:hypothetical protein
VHFLHFACPGKKKRKKKVTEKCKSGPESQNLQPVKKNIYTKKVSEIGSRIYYVAKPEKNVFVLGPSHHGHESHGQGGESRRRPAISRQVNNPY